MMSDLNDNVSDLTLNFIIVVTYLTIKGTCLTGVSLMFLICISGCSSNPDKSNSFECCFSRLAIENLAHHNFCTLKSLQLNFGKH